MHFTRVCPAKVRTEYPSVPRTLPGRYVQSWISLSTPFSGSTEIGLHLLSGDPGCAVPVQMWASPGADVGGFSVSRVQVQTSRAVA